MLLLDYMHILPHLVLVLFNCYFFCIKNAVFFIIYSYVLIYPI